MEGQFRLNSACKHSNTGKDDDDVDDDNNDNKTGKNKRIK